MKHNKFEKSFGSEDRVNFIKSLPCLVCGNTPCDNAHVKSRGAGGDYTCIVPLCRVHHTEQGMIGIKTFQNKYNLALDAIAELLGRIIPIDGKCDFRDVLDELHSLQIMSKDSE